MALFFSECVLFSTAWGLAADCVSCSSSLALLIATAQRSSGSFTSNFFDFWWSDESGVTKTKCLAAGRLTDCLIGFIVGIRTCGQIVCFARLLWSRFVCSVHLEGWSGLGELMKMTISLCFVLVSFLLFARSRRRIAATCSARNTKPVFGCYRYDLQQCCSVLVFFSI